MKVKVVIKDSNGKELLVYEGEVSKPGDLEQLGKEALHQARLNGHEIMDTTLSFDKAKEG